MMPRETFVFINTVMVNWRNIPRNEYLTMNIHDFSNYLDICVFDLVMEKKSSVSAVCSSIGIFNSFPARNECAL